MGLEDDLDEGWFEAQQEEHERQQELIAADRAARRKPRIAQGLTELRSRIIAAEFRAEEGDTEEFPFNPYVGKIAVFDAERLREEGERDQVLLDPKCDLLPHLTATGKSFPYALIRDIRVYTALSSWLQSGDASHEEFDSDSSHVRDVQASSKRVGELRTSLIIAGQETLITRIDRALFARREKERQQRNP